MPRCSLIGAALAVLFGTACLGHASYAQESAAAVRLDDQSSGEDWAAYGRTFGEQHYSPLDEINDKTVGKLGLAWSIDLTGSNSVTAPLEVGGVLFYTNHYSVVHAVDAATGKHLWDYDPKVPDVAGPKLRISWGSRGIAWWNDKIYVGTADGRLIAINAKTGSPVWSASTTEPGDARYITQAPRVFDGMVIVGHGGGDFSATRGYVTAYDAETGEKRWRFYTVPGDPAKGFENKAMAMAAKTWQGEWWKGGGGGAVWNAITYDKVTDTVFIGTGNAEPWNQKARSLGDNLFACSIIALDAKTGAYKWHYQINPGDSWDYDSTMDMELADLTIDGQPRRVLMTAPKNGFFYVIDSTNGKLLSAQPFAKVNWATGIDLKTGRPIENPAARYPAGSTFVMWPSPLGGHNWLPMAYSPRTHLVYIPAIHKAAEWSDVPGATNGTWRKDFAALKPSIAANLNMFVKTDDPQDGTTSLLAWDPVAQKEVWHYPTPGVTTGGVLATGGNLVFQGGLDGIFRAHAADTGKKLWSFAAQSVVIAPPITYSVNGRQYVTVLTGMGTSVGILGKLLQPFHLDYRTQARRVLTFALNGTASIPQAQSQSLVPAEDPTFKADPARAARGALSFALNCSACHGAEAVAAGSAPDLRASAVPVSKEAFTGVVKGGALLENGMPRFDDLSDRELGDIRQYLRTRAADFRRTAANDGKTRD